MARNWNGMCGLFALAFLLVTGFSGLVFAANSTSQTAANAVDAARWSPNATCGWYGISCCANQTCYAGLNCDNGTCLLKLPPESKNSFCGKPGQLCCGGTTCYSGAVCGGGLCQLRDYYNGTICGWLGGNCCGGGVCYTGTSCNAKGTCLQNSAARPAAMNNNSATCGGAGNACCSGNACQTGYECRSGTCQKSSAVRPSEKKITLYTSAQPSAYGQASPSSATGAYGTKMSITARPASGYKFEAWSGDCPISDIYEKNALVTLSTSQSACRITATFSKIAELCGSAGQMCCASNACNTGLMCSSGVCQTAQPAITANITPPKPPVVANETPDSGGNKKPTAPAATILNTETVANNTTVAPPVAMPSINDTPQQCTTGQTGCKCGYGAVCGAGTYCDASSQNCFPECQQGITTGNCMCRVSGAAPHVLWWGVCGTPAAPICGAANQSCCNGITCNSGLGCVSGTCKPKCAMGQTDCPCGYGAPCNGGTYCDTASQLCLPACQYGAMSAGCMCLPQNGAGTPSVNWWGVCGTVPCGAANQTCCSGNACNSGYTCQSGTCRTRPANNTTIICGGANQPCCATGTACTASGYTCQSGTCRQYVPPANNTDCGGAGQLCCGGTTCNAGMTCGGGLCQHSQYFNNSLCGWYGTQCCGGDVCYTGYQCDHGTCLIQLQPETPNSTCGKAGQLCCGGTTCYSNLVCGGGLCQWREFYNSTICGWWGGQCCGGNVCYTGTSCTANGICMPVATSNNTTVCGGDGQLCCSGSACNSGYVCQLGECRADVPPANNTTQIVVLYTESTPGGAGRTYPITTTGVYGSIRDIEAVPELGYDFESWSGNCPVSDVYERVTTILLAPNNRTFCRAIANFPAGGTTCGAYGKPCCYNDTCNAGFACNINKTCVPTNTTLSPDLVIMEIDMPTQVGVGVRAYGTVRITNVGNAPAQNFTMSYYIDGLMVNSVDVPPLPAGGANIAVASFICQRTGTYTLMARADSTSAIVERNETNNELETKFVCVN